MPPQSPSELPVPTEKPSPTSLAAAGDPAFLYRLPVWWSNICNTAMVADNLKIPQSGIRNYPIYHECSWYGFETGLIDVGLME